MTRERIIVGLSGGVDSSVAALRLREQGADVAAMFMKNWEEDDASGTCPAEQDAADAEAVARALGLDFHARNFASEYWDQVFERFLAEHRAGRTPNPDVLCNREIKFKTFVEHAEDLGAGCIATGHYARVDRQDGRYRLLKAVDGNKDQTYFLHQLGQQALSRTKFPVGDLLKPDVRRLAAEAALPTHAKKDSTGICFIGERDFRGFLARYIEPRVGAIETPDGETIGEHAGVMFVTLGQRGGLGIGGRRGANGDAWYVVGKDVTRNVIIVDQGQDSPHLFSRELVADEVSWVAGAAPGTTFDCAAKIRYRQPDQACTVTVNSDATVAVRFAAAQRAVTPGQSVVFYAGDECLGGGVIGATDATWGGQR
jgi:tRNA-uridine 2-sulfurtransferase